MEFKLFATNSFVFYILMVEIQTKSLRVGQRRGIIVEFGHQKKSYQFTYISQMKSISS